MRASLYGLLLVLLLAFASTVTLAETTTVAAHDEEDVDVEDAFEDEVDVEDEDEVDEEEEDEDAMDEEDEQEQDDEADLDVDEDEALDEASLAEVGAPVDIQAATLKKPGSPATYELQPWFYKVWGSADKAKADAMKTTWDNAWTQYALPTPEHEVVQVTYGAGLSGWAFRSKAAKGTFFQFSKGHKNKVITWINTQTSRIELGRLRNVFEAVRAHIGDGQGFFEDGTSHIFFIDINLGGTTPDAADVVAAIDVRLTNPAVH